MAIPFALPTEDETEQQGQHLEQLMLDLYAVLQQVLRSMTVQHPSRNHRIPRRSGDVVPPGYPVILVDSDLSRLPLPDLVLSAVEHLPSDPPLVTVSAPTSPTRDVTFQFPECSSVVPSSANVSSESGSVSIDAVPVPSPRPRPRRRRLISESSAMEKGPLSEATCTSGNCCAHLSQALNERQWANVGANLRNIADDFHAAKTKDAEIEKSRLPLIHSGFSSSSSSASSSTDSLLSLLIPAPLRETLWTTVALYLGWRLVSRLR